MYSKFAQRCLSFLIALAMVLSLTPLQALATETEASAPTETEGTPSEAIETSGPAPEPVTPEAVQARINSLLDFFGITGDMTDDEIAYAIAIVDGNTLKAAMNEIEAIDLQGQTLSDDELQLLDIEIMETYDRLCYVLSQLMIPMLLTEATVLNGQIYIKDDQTRLSESNGTVTVTANGDKGFQDQRKTNTITITNKTGSTATISFDYTISNSDKFTIEGKTYTANDSYTVTLDANEYITLTLKGKHGGWFGSSPGDAVLTLKNFRIVIAAEKSNVTFKFDNTKGSVTVNGAGIDPDDVEEVELNTGAALVATSNSGVTFLGWINAETGFILSTAASFTLKPMEDMIVKAVFVTTASDVGWFLASGGTYLFDDLTKANTHANSAGDKTIILANNGTLSGTHEISSGVTLLIPYDAAGTLCTAKPSEHENAYTAPSVFRTLTMANGSNITVNGAISISGSISSKYGNIGMPSGPYGKINMNSGSKITVNGSAKLYAWGYITGAGSVEINNGGHVYECFQVADYRGGDATTKIVGKDDEYGVFPFNQYYVQNVEVPMTLHAGATETGYSAVYVRMAGHQPMSIPFIGNVENQSMFVISSGYIIKDYMEGTGRTKMGIYGDLKVTKVNVDIKVSLIGDISIDSSKYALPIPQHFNISLESGSVTMNQNVAFFPGSELYIREGTTCTLGSGKKIYVYDLDQWLYNEGKNGYSGTTNLPYMQLKHVPGGDGTTGRLKDALIQIDGTVDASAGSVYVTSGGANIYSTGTGKVIVGSAPDTTVRQVITNGTDVSSWPEIPIVPAILQNAAGKDPASTNTAETTGTYVYRNGIWCTHTDTVYTDSDKNHKCDTCGTVMSACSDVTGDGNHSCDICGTENVSSHTGGAAATCTTAQICTECGATVTPAMGHKWSGTKCSACGIIKLYATNIRAGDFLNMFFYVRAADLDLSEGKNYYAHIEKTYADKRPNVTKDIYYRNADGSQNWETYETDYLRFRFDDISAKEMTDEIHVTIFDSDGKQISTVTTETLRDYAMRLLKTLTSGDLSAKNKKLRTTLIDMLNYGAAAQDFFGDYGINDLANAGCEAYQGWVTGDDVSCEKGTTDKTQGLDSAIVIADNGLTLRLYFNNLSDTTGLTATISYQNHHGNKVERTTTEFDTTTASPLVGVGITGLAIADGRQLVTCTITNGEDTTVASGTYSVERYLAMHKADDAVYLKLMKFIDSAYNYFHS